MSWNKPSSDSQSAARKAPKASPSLVRGVVAGLVVAVLGIAAFFVFNGKSAKPKVEKPVKKPAQIEEVKPAAAPKTVVKPVEDKARVARESMAEKIKKMTPDERWQYFLEQAKKQPLDLTPRSNQVYRTSTEQMLAMVFGTRLGDKPPHLPNNLPLREQAHFAEVLIADNPILDTDSEKTRQAKENIAAAKKELIKFIKDGGEAGQFFDYYRGELEQAHGEWLETQKSVFKVIKDDPDIAEAYINEVNDRLGSKGIKPVVIPPKFRERLGRK